MRFWYFIDLSSNEGSGEPVQMRRVTRAFTGSNSPEHSQAQSICVDKELDSFDF